MDRVVVNKTGLTGNYDFTLKVPPDGKPASLLAAMPEQLGLQLNGQTGPVEMLVIEHAEPIESAGGPLNVSHRTASQAQSQAEPQGSSPAKKP